VSRPTVDFPEALTPGLPEFLRITVPPSPSLIYAIARFDSARLWISGPNRSLSHADRFELSTQEDQPTEHTLTIGRKDAESQGIEPIEIYFVDHRGRAIFPGRSATIRLLSKKDQKPVLKKMVAVSSKMINSGVTKLAAVITLPLLIALLAVAPVAREKLLITAHILPRWQTHSVTLAPTQGFQQTLESPSSWILKTGWNVGDAKRPNLRDLILINEISPETLTVAEHAALYDFIAAFRIWFMSEPGAGWILQSSDKTVGYTFVLAQKPAGMYLTVSEYRSGAATEQIVEPIRLPYTDCCLPTDSLTITAEVRGGTIAHTVRRLNFVETDANGHAKVDGVGRDEKIQAFELPRWPRHGTFGFFSPAPDKQFLLETVQILPEPEPTWSGLLADLSKSSVAKR
jgi:hypothetical protein